MSHIIIRNTKSSDNGHFVENSEYFTLHACKSTKESLELALRLHLCIDLEYDTENHVFSIDVVMVTVLKI